VVALRRLFDVAASLAVASLCATGCGNARAASVTTERDTLVAYGTQTFRLPLIVRDRDGAEPRRWDATLQIADTSILEGEDERVRCRRAGRTDLVAEVDGQSVRLTVHCRPTTRFETQYFHELVVGRAPTSLEIRARFSTGSSERVDPISVYVSDTTVVQFVGDSIIALAAGHAQLTVNVGGTLLPIQVAVTEIIADDSLALTAGEFRSWSLGRGSYEIWVRGLDAAFRRAATELEGEGTKCFRATRDEHTINCLVADRGGVAIRNILENGPTQRVGVRILKRP